MLGFGPILKPLKIGLCLLFHYLNGFELAFLTFSNEFGKLETTLVESW